MNFIKKHYEKIILAVFLLIFILSLIWTIIVLNKSLDVTTEDLKMGKILADYPVAKMEEYEVSANFKKDKQWGPAYVVDPEDKTKSCMDLLVPYVAMRCSKCLKIIPLSAFFNEKCPLCQGELEKPTEVRVNTELDKDKDGIPDADELRLGLNPNNPEDAYLDMDDDGFNNLCEFKEGTDLKDPASFPNPSIKLFAKSISRKSLPFKLDKVVPSGGEENKSKWEIRAWTGKGLKKLKFYKMGDTIELDGDKYTVTDIIQKTVNKIDKNKRTVTEDASEIIMKRENDEPITVSPGTIAKENKDRITLVDFVTKEKYVTSKGSSFDVKWKGKAVARYTVEDVSYKDKIVTLKDEKEDKEYKVGTKSVFEEKKFMKPEGEETIETDPNTGKPPEMMAPNTKPSTKPGMMPPEMMPPRGKTPSKK